MSPGQQLREGASCPEGVYRPTLPALVIGEVMGLYSELRGRASWLLDLRGRADCCFGGSRRSTEMPIIGGEHYGFQKRLWDSLAQL